MAGVSIGQGGRARGGWSFFATMSLVIALIITAGFGPSYAASLAPPGLPIWVHLHGAVMVCWIALFAFQAALVRWRSYRLHRTLGFASIALVVVMVPLGIATDLLAIRRGATPPFFTPAMMFSSDLTDMLLFAGLFGWAVALRRRSDWHKRLMLCATVLLTWPALGRLAPLHAFGLAMIVPLSLALLVALALVGPLHDFYRRRRIHPAYGWGVGLIVAVQPLHVILAASAPVTAVVAAVTPHPGIAK
ncbi:hypothetical protein U1839_01715 [Sphingomonas sp. RT2P30]|uniref:hypothetical protein n=1 Tax=Parasphingomonas halimpatiens TaxID=3096162 RepID=UPI002FCA2918